MKVFFRLLFVLAVLSSAGLMVSCEPDDTLDNDPSDIRNEYVGVWRFTESGYWKSGQLQSYIVTISLDPDNSSQVLLENFGNPGLSQSNTVTGIVTTNQIVVSSQTLTNGWIVEGSGKKASGGKMDWSYSITAGGDEEYYTATAVKQ